MFIYSVFDDDKDNSFCRNINRTFAINCASNPIVYNNFS